MKILSRERLEDLPGVGPSIADDLRRIGIAHPSQLLGAKPEDLYERLVALDGPTDRCVLYVFRAAHYYVDTPDPELNENLLLWWHWKESIVAD